MKKGMTAWVFALALAPAAAAEMTAAYRECLMNALAEADPRTTVGELKLRCLEQQEAVVEPRVRLASEEKSVAAERLRQEAVTEELEFVITPYLPNYILLAAWNSAGVNERPFREQYPGETLSLQDVEAKFQISFKFPLARSLFGDNGDLYAAYTNRSFWQVYDDQDSAPFRETNHQPELWLRFYSGREFLGLRNLANDIGIVHQSNGRGGRLSRSWNRIYARFLFEKGNFAFAVQPWWRIPEDEEDDDNPDIEDYLGNFEFQGAYKWGVHEFGLMFRNNLNLSRNRGAVQLDWSFPLYGKLRGYVQWFNGYGESLIDYDASVNSIGAGFLLTDRL